MTDSIIYKVGKVTITDNTGTYSLEEWRALPAWHDDWNRFVGDLKLHRALTRREYSGISWMSEQPN